MTINLSSEGIFPIIYDKNGNKLKNLPNTGLNYSGTIQGEGRLMGVPSLFIRTSGCNLRCLWRNNKYFMETCDTPHTSWHNENFKYEIEDIIQIIKHNSKNGIKHIVITGGEPLIQKKSLTELCKRIKEKFGYHITIETNGTIFIEELFPYVDLFSISPKLSNSDPTKEKIDIFNEKFNKNEEPIKTKINHGKVRYNIDVLQKYVLWNKNQNFIPTITGPVPSKNSKIQLKFVIGSKIDIDEIKVKYIYKLPQLNSEDIYLMPLGMTPETLNITTKLTVNECIKNNWNFSGRLHINLFDTNFGV